MADIAPAPAKPVSNLRLRVISALVLAAVALGATWIGGEAFTILWIAAAIAVFIEWLLLTDAHTRAAALVGAVGLSLVAFIAPSFFGDGAFAFATRIPSARALGMICIGAAILVFVLSKPNARFWGAAGFFYAAVIAFVPPFLRADPVDGLLSVLLLYGVVWGTDIGAYFTGRAIGGPKLWPRLSPKKTWSGLIGGMVAGVALAWFFFYLHDLVITPPPGSPPAIWPVRQVAIPLTLFLALCAVVSQGGDLLESAIKRKFDVKDASQIIPGHGGLMDRLDGFWAACIVFGGVMLAAEAFR